jgi:hypothetical protein
MANVELEDVMTKIMEHALGIGKLMRAINDKEHMQIKISAPEFHDRNGYLIPFNLEIPDSTLLRILSGTHTRAMNFNEVNCYLQKKFNVEYDHKVYHSYKLLI